MCFELVQKLAYSTSQEQYAELHGQLKDSCPVKVVKYFNENWDKIKDEWVLGFKSASGNFLNTTNNRLESINGKLKQVISRYCSLEKFVAKFFIILTSLRTERDHKAGCAKQSRFNILKRTPQNQTIHHFSLHMLFLLFTSNCNCLKLLCQRSPILMRYILSTQAKDQRLCQQKGVTACSFHQ